MRASASRPSRSTSNAVDTLSTESRLTAERSGTGSSPGSRQTSLGIPRTVVVQGAINARRRRGIAASRESTTTGRRPISASSHHHTSPRAGWFVMKRRPRCGMMPSRPTRLVRRVGVRRTRRRRRRPPPPGGSPTAPSALRPQAQRPVCPTPSGRSPGDLRPLWCSDVCGSCHKYAMRRSALARWRSGDVFILNSARRVMSRPGQRSSANPAVSRLLPATARQRARRSEPH
jgi:hypothetical protein